MGQQLDQIILEILSNLNASVITLHLDRLKDTFLKDHFYFVMEILSPSVKQVTEVSRVFIRHSMLH